MIILLHVVVALVSVVSALLTVLFPSRFRMQLSELLVAATLLSGTYLVLRMHALLAHACVSGLAYLAVTLSAMVFARRRLVSVKQSR
jgi:hypothetical protein